MITSAEYEQVQALLGRKGRPRPKRHTFAFTGFIRCGECGCLITAEKKTKRLKRTGEIRTYTYYHCTRKRSDVLCSQRKHLREDELEAMIVRELEKYTILPQFREWALEVLNQSHEKEVNARKAIYEMRHKVVVETQRQLDNLVTMRYRDLITDAEYTRERSRLQNELVHLKAQLRETEERAQRWVTLTEKAFDFATYARDAFLTGTIETKKAILMALGQNPTIEDGKLRIEATSWLKPIAEAYPPLAAEYRRLEPAETCVNKTKNEALASIRQRWLPIVDDVRTKIGAFFPPVSIPSLPHRRLAAVTA